MLLTILFGAFIVIGILGIIISRRMEPRRRENILGEVEVLDITEAEKHMKDIASGHKLTGQGNEVSRLVAGIKRNTLEIRRCHDYLINVPEKLVSFVPAAQWLIDNYYLIDKEAKVLKQNLKKVSYKRLPILSEGQFKGYPRIYAVVREMINCTGYHLDEDYIINLTNAYQSVNPLTLDEVWALLDILKICLLENLSEVSHNVVENVKIKFEANRVMDEVLEHNSFDGDELVKLFEVHIKDEEQIAHPAFATHMLYRLKENAADDETIRNWIIKRLESKNIDLASIINLEGQKQARLQIVMGSLITSVREESGLDFERLFDEISYTEKILLDDPVGQYGNMNFETRIDYHKRLQVISRNLDVDEITVAKKAVELSQENFKQNGEAKLSHVGYYLMGKGRKVLEQELNYNPSIGARIKNWTLTNNGAWYFTAIALISILIIFSLLWYTSRRVPQEGYGMYSLIVLVLLVPAVSISVEIVNYIYLKIITPKKLPSMDFIEEIPDEFKTIVVMPVVLGSKDQVGKYIERLETYHLGNKDKNIHFGILGDMKDGSKKDLEEDKEILDAAIDGINKLNRMYSSSGSSFFLFNRERKWNEKQGCWMGWERKRGILEQFNSTLLGENSEHFSTIIGDKSILSSFKYVITIDAGTELVRDSAKKLIGLMAHPLNTPILSKDKTKVEDGYTIIQPRVGIRVSSALSTYFSRIFSGQAGIDTYTPAVSDIYQDVFEKGTFAGKGIYDPRVFHTVMSPTIPENAVLSHDLLEGCYVQCALATNVELMDDFPSSISSFFMREHRWIRGDWQLIRWLFGRNPLSALARYKIADNLRRSLIPASHILIIFLALTLVPWSLYVWGTLVLFTTVFPLLLHVSKTTVLGFEKYGTGFNIVNHLKNILLTGVQGLIWFGLLPYRAHISLDAIFRTLHRVLISKKKLLEWKTAEAVERSLSNNLYSNIRRMWISIAASVVLLLIARRELSPIAAVISLIWVIAPFVSYYLSVPVKKKQVPLNQSELKDLRLISRKTWRYFEELFTEEDNWIIPDNYQVWPENGIAHRTSTTNIGLQLLCTLSARDFGYISISNFMNRIEKVFETLSKLDKWNGHFYNWYDTRTLDVLIPKYVSTVDSGNFIGSLITLKNGLVELKDKPVFSNDLFEGLDDTIRLANIDLEVRESKDIDKFVSVLKSIQESNKTNDEVELKWLNLLRQMCSDFLKDFDNFKINKTNSSLTLKELSDNNEYAKNILINIDKIIGTIEEIMREIEFKPLYDKKRGLFKIGYNATSGVYDNSYYDLLASEARLASFIAIAKGEIPQKHWFKLGRTITLVNGSPTLVSWSGTMFEYLMPTLLMKVIPSTLLQHTAIGAVRRQIQYSRDINSPWGMSEAAYYRFDQHLNYQYRAIGVPGLGFSTDLGRFLVIAPYATMLALNIEPKEAYLNIQKMRELGAEGDYGLYEAIDFITPKNNSYRKSNVVKSFFAHHQGMSLISLCNFLKHKNMQERFHKEPMIRATELVLEEKQPKYIILRDTQKDVVRSDSQKRVNKGNVKRIVKFTKPKYPIAHVLSNNNYMIMLTSTGAGFSSHNDVALNRWRADATDDSFGMFFFIRDLENNKYWSSSYQPTKIEPDDYEVVFSLDKVEYKRRDGDIDTKTEVIVSPQDSIEIRRITLTNNGEKEAKLETTSYFEAVIDKYNNDLAHPAFSKLFVETEYVEEKHLLLATRRPREKANERKWLLHTVLLEEGLVKEIEFETDRSKFIGRGNTLSSPEAVASGFRLSNTVGKVLDTVMSLRTRISIAPGKSKTITYITGIANTRQDAMKLAYEYRKPHVIEDTYKMAQYDGEVEMQYLDINPQQANAVQDIVGSIYYPSMLTRGSEESIVNNKRGQSSLWRFGISGDHPIILLRVSETSEIDSVRDVILAYEYLRMKGVKVDLVILNEQEEGYFQELSQKIRDLISNIKVYDTSTRSSGAFLLRSSAMEPEEVTLLLTVARVVLTGENRLLSRRLRNIMLEEPKHNLQAPQFSGKSEYPDITVKVDELEYFNGIGGFSKDGKEYVIILKEKHNTPAPWINVISNKSFGFHISSSGSGYTWHINSRENKLTTWSNDPVSDQPSEAIFIRDEITGEYFTPTPLPVREDSIYKVRHGFGYSIFEHNSLGIEQSMTVFAAQNDPVKIYKVSLENKTDQKRSLSLTYYAELVLGVARDQAYPYIITDMDSTDEILIARNSYNSDFPEGKAFMFCSEKLSSYTGERAEFIGKNSIERPYGMLGKELNNKVGTGLEPCGALKANFNLNPGERKEIVFAIGQASNIDEIKGFATKYKLVKTAAEELDRVKEYWNRILGQIQVSTPDTATNFMLNGWLQYQVLSCRIQARAAFYQAGGAFGFRDQLQDVMSLLHTEPSLTREAIIRHSGRQFLEGDVQHWWHNDSGRGVRTRMSDDLLWLPFATAIYIKNTGDMSILDEKVNYLEDAELGQNEYDRFSIPNKSEKAGTVFEHCVSAIERGLHLGEHGLPLMGTGDWNDGMSKVGIEERGESVWLAWFIYKVLNEFAHICEMKEEKDMADRYRKAAQDLQQNIEKNAWDGEWYLRAYFDNGQPLGSRQNTECQIDSIAQSWSVISDGGRSERTTVAMESVLKHLVKEENQIVLLLTPPFDKSNPDPGYIRGYIPGIRENGGQYTHAAVWNVIAFAKLRMGDTAYNIFKMLNPIYHGLTYTDAAKYKNEPYVMSADIYSTPPHEGRGGWSWYTGAAGWMYQAGIEWILGIQKVSERLIIDPNIPSDWKTFEVRYIYKSTTYKISVNNPEGLNNGVRSVVAYGSPVSDNTIPLIDDGQEHTIVVILGSNQ